MIDKFFYYIDHHGIVRRIVLFVTLWTTWESFRWAANFAETSVRDGSSVAMIIAAVVAPLSLLQSTVFKTYIEGRKE
jgi:hypothetical protein